MKFLGYRRPDGSVGVRNYIAVIPTVVCANSVVSRIASQIPGAVPILHNQGCTQLTPDLEQVTRTLVGLGRNPNVAAVLVVSLGCECVSLDEVVEKISESKKPVEGIVILDLGGEIKAVEKGTRIVEGLSQSSSEIEKESFDLEDLIVGVKCGASDATSGLSSNPATGIAVDEIIKGGGSVIFGETTEFIGAEHILAKRASDEKVSKRIYEIVESMENRAKSIGVDMRSAQPTSGNIRGGLTTIEEKSLGAIVKGGYASRIKGVLEYAERPREKGLHVMDTPGRENEYMTGIAAAGVQIIVFTTGLGAPQGFPFVPVIKVTGNPKTFERMSDHMDVSVSKVMEGKEKLDEAGDRIVKEIIRVASGKRTKAEVLGYGGPVGIWVNGLVI
jgi:altronate dehydratase large subunit